MPTFTDDAWKCDVHYDHRKLGRHCSVINVFVNHQTNTFRLLIFAVFPTFPSFNYLITWIITCDLIYIAFLKIYKTRKQLIQNISHQVFYRPNAFLPFESYAKYIAESWFNYLKCRNTIILSKYQNVDFHVNLTFHIIMIGFKLLGCVSFIYIMQFCKYRL